MSFFARGVCRTVFGVVETVGAALCSTQSVRYLVSVEAVFFVVFAGETWARRRICTRPFYCLGSAFPLAGTISG